MAHILLVFTPKQIINAIYKITRINRIANVSQIQLMQPFLTICASKILLNEPFTATTLGFALAAVPCVALGKKLGKLEFEKS